MSSTQITWPVAPLSLRMISTAGPRTCSCGILNAEGAGAVLTLMWHARNLSGTNKGGDITNVLTPPGVLPVMQG